MRAFRRPRGLVVGAVAAMLALTGCQADDAAEPQPPAAPEADADRWDPAQGGNGIWLLSGRTAIAEIVAAMRDAGPVTYSGTFTELVTPEDSQQDPRTGRRMTVRYAGEYGDLRASIAAGDLTVEVVMADGLTYVRGNAAFAERTGVAAARDGFVCTTSPDALLADWAPLLEPPALVEQLVSGAEEFAVMPPEEGADATRAVLGASESPFGTMTVATSGPPLPSDLLAGDVSGDADFRFEGWGTAPGITPPTELSQPCS